MKVKLIQIILVFFIVAGCGHKQTIANLTAQAAKAADDKNYTQAIKDYSETIRLYPNFEPAYVARGDIFMILEQPDKAIQDLNEAIRLNPKNYVAYQLRGSAYYANQQLDKTINDLSFALENRVEDSKTLPLRGHAFKIRGLAYYWSGSFTNAIADLTEAAKYLPDDYEIYERRGDCYDRRTDSDKAVSDFNKAIQLKHDTWISFYGRGHIFSHIGEYAKAIQDFEKVIQLKPNASKAYNLLAWLLATCPKDEIRDGKRAIGLATEACGMTKWTNYAYVDTLAAAYAETRDFDQAVKYQKQVVSMKGIPESNRTNIENRVQLYLQGKPYRIPQSFKN